ncbi:MAG TPA: TIGR03564 family F420-dependent LLM class oxidoreductase [Myxococcota bacterium]|nr:TIGR03564 family F420-dependent LLM class oxidoreductase [Myxococcota bacterium]
MRIGWNGGGAHTRLDAIRAEARRAAQEGFASYWLSQALGPDALVALAVVGAETPGIELGTSIVPLYGRHVLVLAAQALTANAAAGGRLVLGIGPSHQPVVEGMFCESYARPFTRTRETLTALRALFAGDAVELAGEEVRARGRLALAGASLPVLVAALGPRMLELAGREAAGTILWMVGARTVRAHIAPRIRQAAQAAGRPAPRIVAGVPVCVTDDVARAREFAAQKLRMYGALPAYRAMLEREGVSGPEDLLVAGSASKVRDQLAEYAAAGATDLRAGALCASESETERTRALLAELARQGGLE